jgi:hypothetical protein
MESALILVEVVTGRLVTTTESATMVKMRITVQRIVVATMMEYVNLVEEKTNIHVSMIADVIPTQYVNLTEEKLLVIVKTVPVVVEVVKHQVVAQILVKEEGHGIGQHPVVKLNQVVIIHLFGLAQSASATLLICSLMAFVVSPLNETVYLQEVLHGMIGNTDVCVQVNM